MLYKITRTTCEKVRSQMKKAQKINRRATLICLLLSTRSESHVFSHIYSDLFYKGGHSLTMFRPS